jgi:hypothetical protein
MVTWLVTVLGGCSSDEEDTSTESMAPSITGTITLESIDTSGEVQLYKAFGFDQGGKLISYLSNNPNATCASTVDYLQDHNSPYDPSDFLVGGTCDIYFSHSDWTGSVQATDDPFAVAGMTVNCAFGDGEFVLETRDVGDRDYYWSGRWWQGHPTVYTMDMSGTGESGYEFSLSLTEYDGNLIYEEMDAYPATGEVSGTMSVEWCPELGTTPLFR